MSAPVELHWGSYSRCGTFLDGDPPTPARGVSRGMRLTAKERVLLHLLEAAHSGEAVEVPVAQTQEGLARGAGIDLRHLIQFVRPLVVQGLVRERTAHVTGRRQRMKVYDLTQPGRAAAIRLRERVKSEVVRVRDGNTVHEDSLDRALHGIGAGASLLEAVRQVQEAGILDVEVARRPPESNYVEQLWDAPRIGTFVGRQEELSEILHEDAGARVYVIRGVAGIGKSVFAAKACDLLRGRRNLFWHRIRPWESEQALLASLSRFLESIDRPGLASVLKRGQLGMVAEVLRQDLPDTHAVLVFDDAHEASQEALGFFRMLTEAVASAVDIRILVLSRRALPFYDVRDVTMRGIVREIELRGLKSSEAAALLAVGEESANLAGLGRRLAGHPLFLDLVRSHRYDIPAAVKDVERFIEEAIYRGLSVAEKTTMKVASLYQVPVPRKTLLSIPGASYEALASLRDRSLIRFVGRDRYEVHDTIRDFFTSVLTPAESVEFGALAVRELRALAAEGYATGEFASSTDYLSNALRLSRDVGERAEIQEALGDAQGRTGDLPAALVWYKDAVRVSPNAESSARLHRKLAAVLHGLGETLSASAEVAAAAESLREEDRRERGWLELVQARMSDSADDWASGRAHAEAALELFRSCGDTRGQAEALVELAIVHINSPSGDPSSANACLEEAVRLAAPIGDPSLAANAHVQLANLYAYRLGDADRAMDHLAAIEALPGALVDVRSRLSLLMLEGWLNLDLRADFQRARANFDEALALSRKLHDPVTVALARHGGAMAAYHAGDCVAAQAQLDVAASELLALGYAGLSAEAEYSAAEISLILGDHRAFRRRRGRMKEPDHAHGLEVRPVLALVLHGFDCIREGDRDGVHAAFQEAIRLAEREASPQERPMISSAHDAYGVALAAMGELREAREQERLAVESAERFGLKGRLVARIGLIPPMRDSLRAMFAASQSPVPAE